jgi:hypothetical protein
MKKQKKRAEQFISNVTKFFIFIFHQVDAHSRSVSQNNL